MTMSSVHSLYALALSAIIASFVVATEPQACGQQLTVTQLTNFEDAQITPSGLIYDIAGGGDHPQAVLYNSQAGSAQYGNLPTGYDYNGFSISNGGLVATAGYGVGPPAGDFLVTDVPGQAYISQSPQGALGILRVNGVNNSGTVVGQANLQAVAISDGNETAILPNIYNYSSAVAINDVGTIVGTATAYNGSVYNFQNSKGVFSQIPLTPIAINNNNQILGQDPNTPYSDAAIYSGGILTDLGTLPGEMGSTAVAMNDRGQVVGEAGVNSAGTEIPFLYSNGTLFNIYSLLPANAPNPLYVTGISDNGTITAINGNNSYTFTISEPPTTVSWSRPVSANWSIASNWTPATVPVTTITANFSTGSSTPYAVTLTGASAANNLTVQGDKVGITTGGNTLAVSGSITVDGAGSTTGALSIDGGALSVAGNEVIGNTGAATFTQTGGTHTIAGSLTLGQATGSQGTFSLSAGSLSVTGNEVVGSTGAATFNQTGGTHTIGGSLTIAANSGSTGSYNLQAGTLSAPSVVINPGGQLFGNSTITGNVSNGGLVSPGTSTAPGNLSLGGNYTQTAGGTLNIRVNGTSTSEAIDSMTVSGFVALNGTLRVTTPTIPAPTNPPTTLSFPYGNMYNIVDSNSAVLGVFNNGASVVKSTDGSGNTTGVFDIRYSKNDVTLSHFHQIHVLSCGVSFPSYVNLQNKNQLGLNGGATAVGVSQAFANVPGVVDNTPLQLSSTAPPTGFDDNVAVIQAYVSGESQLVHPGDLCVFYIGSHGTYDPSLANQETPLERQLTVPTSTTSATFSAPVSAMSTIGLAGDGHSATTDELDPISLTSMFNTPQWSDVNKLFVIDSCYAGGFAAGPDGAPQYLLSLPKSAVIYSSPENLLSSYSASNGEGLLGIGFQQVLENLPDQSLDFQQLLSDVQTTVQGDQVNGYQNGYVADGQAIWNQGEIQTQDTVGGAATSDFSLDLSGGSSVPEPGTALFLFSCVLAAFLRRRTRLSFSSP